MKNNYTIGGSSNSIDTLLSRLDTKISYFQSSTDISYNDYEKNKELHGEKFTGVTMKKNSDFYNNRNTHLFSKDEYELDSIESEVVNRIASSPHAYSEKILNFAEKFFTSVIENSNNQKKSDAKQETDQIRTKLYDVIKDRKLSESEVRIQINDIIEKTKFMKIAKEDSLSTDKQTSDSADDFNKLNQQIANITDMVTDNRDICHQIQGELTKRGDPKISTQTETLELLAKSINEKKNGLLTRNNRDFENKSDTDATIISSKEFDNKIMDCIDNDRNPDDVFSLRSQTGIAEDIKSFQEILNSLCQKKRNLELADIATTVFFDEQLKPEEEILSPSEYLTQFTVKSPNKEDLKIAQNKDLEKLIQREEHVKKIIVDEFKKRDKSIEKEEAQKLVSDITGVISQNFIANNSSQFQQSLVNSFQDNESKQHNDDTSIMSIRDLLYNKLDNQDNKESVNSDNGTINISENIINDRYVFDKELKTKICSMHNVEKLMSSVSEKQMTANEAKALLKKRKSFSKGMNNETINKTEDLLDLISEKSISLNTNKDSLFIKENGRDDKDKVYRDTGYNFKKDMVDNILIEPERVNSIFETGSWLIGNKKSFEALKVCSNKQVPARSAETNDSLIDGCIQKFEQDLNNDLQETKQAFKNLGGNPLAPFTGIPIILTAMIIIQEAAVGNYWSKKIEAEQKIFDVVEHLQKIPGDKNKELVSILYKLDLSPKSNVIHRVDKENLLNIEDDLRYQTFFKAGNSKIKIDNEYIRINEVDFNSGEGTEHKLSSVLNGVLDANSELKNGLLEEIRNNEKEGILLTFKEKVQSKELEIDELEKLIREQEEVYLEANKKLNDIIQTKTRAEHISDGSSYAMNTAHKKLQNGEHLSDSETEEALTEAIAQRSRIKEIEKDLHKLKNVQNEKKKEVKNKKTISKSVRLLNEDGDLDMNNINHVINNDPAALIQYINNMDTLKEVHGAVAIKSHNNVEPGKFSFVNSAKNAVNNIIGNTNSEVSALDEAINFNKQKRKLIQELNHVILNKSISKESNNLLDRNLFEDILDKLEIKDAMAQVEQFKFEAKKLIETNEQYKNYTIHEAFEVVKERSVMFKSQKSINKALDFGVIEQNAPSSKESIITITTKENEQRRNENIDDYVDINKLDPNITKQEELQLHR